MPKSLKGKPIPRAKALKAAKELIKEIKPYIYRYMFVGSLHRNHATVGDIDLLVIPKTKSRDKLPGSFLFKGTPVNIFFTTKESWGASTLHWRTGRASIQIKQYAIKKGFKLNRYGLFKRDTNEKVAGKTEEGIFQALGLKYPGKKWKGPGTMKLIPVGK